jgi:hypothetical protein
VISDRCLLLNDVNARQDKMVELVERMLDPSAGSGQALHKQLPKAKSMTSMYWMRLLRMIRLTPELDRLDESELPQSQSIG